jgi:8-amino-7-oxononanoate synthase
LISGTTAQHPLAEQEIASWVQLPSTLLFSSGYAANVGALTALTDERSVVISDALNHASIIDGCRLSRAIIRIVPHCDLRAVAQALSAARDASCIWVVTESYFSMDGDSPDLSQLRELCDAHSAGLVVDEAHALGVFGPEGAGQCAAHGVRPDVLIGTLGKAVGVQGAFVAGQSDTMALLWNRARSFVFSTAISPLLAHLIRVRVERVRADEALRSRLRAMAERVREQLGLRRVPVAAGSHGPILPIVFGEVDRTLRASALLRERGIWAPAIRPPTVPRGGARLRVTLTASWTEDTERRLVDALSEVCAAL